MHPHAGPFCTMSHSYMLSFFSHTSCRLLVHVQGMYTLRTPAAQEVYGHYEVIEDLMLVSGINSECVQG